MFFVETLQDRAQRGEVIVHLGDPREQSVRDWTGHDVLIIEGTSPERTSAQGHPIDIKGAGVEEQQHIVHAGECGLGASHR